MTLEEAQAVIKQQLRNKIHGRCDYVALAAAEKIRDKFLNVERNERNKFQYTK